MPALVAASHQPTPCASPLSDHCYSLLTSQPLPPPSSDIAPPFATTIVPATHEAGPHVDASAPIDAHACSAAARAMPRTKCHHRVRSSVHDTVPCALTMLE